MEVYETAAFYAGGFEREKAPHFFRQGRSLSETEWLPPVMPSRVHHYVQLNNDTEVITPEWIEEMLMFAQRKDVGAVGTMLRYPDGSIQHAGVVVGWAASPDMSSRVGSGCANTGAPALYRISRLLRARA